MFYVNLIPYNVLCKFDTLYVVQLFSTLDVDNILHVVNHITRV